MSVGGPLRLYFNTVKLLLYLLITGVFTLAGFWLQQNSEADPLFVLAGWVFLIFFGLATAAVLFMIVRNVIFRLPLLQIDEKGWTSRNLLLQKRAASWPDIERIGIYRQWMGQPGLFRLGTTHTYYLVAYGKDRRKMTRDAFWTTAERFHRSLHEASIAIPVNSVFLRTTPERVERLLEHVRTTYAHDLQLNGIAVSNELGDV
ncbi:MAG: STM3941 family protein [Ktedonobacterales bacterium]